MKLDLAMTFLGYDAKGTGNIRKNRQLGLYENLVHQRQYQWSKKTIPRMEETIWKSYIDQELIVTI